MEPEETGGGPLPEGRTRRARLIAAAVVAIVGVGAVAAVALAGQDDSPVVVGTRSGAPDEPDAEIGSAVSDAVTTVATTQAPVATSTTLADPEATSLPPVVTTPAPPATVATVPPTIAPTPGVPVVEHPEAVAPYWSIAFDPAGASVDANAVIVRFWGGNQACYLLHDVAVTETSTTVTITLTGGTKAGVEVCTQEAVYYEVRVLLAAPLGTRTLLSGA